MPGQSDILSQILSGSLEGTPSGETPGWLGQDPERMSMDRAATIEAIKHALVTGQPPAEMPTPTYGPIDSILKGIGLRSKFKPTNPGVQEDISLARGIKTSQDQESVAQKLGRIQSYGTAFGSEAARGAAPLIGAPELAATLPKNVPGKGEIALSAQDVQMQRAMLSNDMQQKTLAEKYFAAETRAAAAENNSTRLQQLADITSQREHLAEDKQNDAPINQLVQDTMTGLSAKENHLLSLQNSILSSGGTVDPAAMDAIQKQMDIITQQRRRLLQRREKIRSGADLDSILYGTDSGSDTSKPAPSGATHYKPLPAVD